MSKTGARFKGKAMITILVLLLMMSSISPSLLAVDKSIDISASTIFIDGDWIVSDTNVTENKEIILNGNLTITSTGSLTFNNVTLKFNQTANGEYTLNVNSGGEFYVDKSNITSNNSYYYWFEVHGKLQFNNSKLSRTYAQVGKWGGIHVYSNDVYVGNSTFYDYSGAGMTIETANTTIYNCTFQNGFRGIWAWYWGNITVERCIFVNISDAALKTLYDVNLYIGNSTIRDGLDGVSAVSRVQVTAYNVTVFNNTNGIGFYIRTGSRLQAMDINTTNNLYGIWGDADVNVTIYTSVVVGNDAGIYITSDSNATIINCTINNNTQTGVQVSSSNATMINCTINNNTQTGVQVSSSTATIINSTIEGNTIGVRVGGNFYNTTIINSTIVNNGNGVECGAANTSLLNCTVSGNTNLDYSISSEGRIFIKWFLDVNVLNQTDVPIPNANVRVYNRTNGLIFDDYTAVGGWRRWIPVTNRSMYRSGINPVETTYYDPHNITAEYNAVSNYTVVTMNASKEILIKLNVEFDYDLPIIEHVPITSAPLGEGIEITANVSDSFGVGNVSMYYQNVGDTEYSAVNMSLASGNEQNGYWTASIPAQTETGLVHYFIWANDTSGNNATLPAMGDYAIQITGPPSIGVTYPIGGEDWTGGSNHQIEFTASDTEDNQENLTVFLNYSYYSRTINGTIDNMTGNGSPYIWTLPVINATDVVVNATVIDSDGNKAYDDSQIFAIDSSPPEVSSTNPVNNTTGISIFQPIVIRFNEKMNISSVIVNQTNGTDPGGWSWFWNEDKDSITGIHDSWPRGEVVEMTIQPGYKDYSDPGNANNTAYVFSFTTETNPSPEISHTNISSPQELGDEIRINATITDDGTVMNAVLWWQDAVGVWHENYMDRNGDDWEYIIPGQMAEGKVEYQINATDDLQQKNTTAIYDFDIEDSTPPVITHMPIESAVVSEPINISCQISDLGGVGAVYLHYKNETDTNFMQIEMNANYWYEIPSYSPANTIEYYIQAVDVYGNDATTQTYSLEIIDPKVPDTTSPEILLAAPTGANVPLSTDISIVFSEAVNRTSVEEAISISPIMTGISYNWLDNQTLVVEVGELSYNTTYTVIIDTGARDLAGNTLAKDYSWQFTTLSESEIVQQPASNDWLWIGIIIFLSSFIVLMVASRVYDELNSR